MRLRFFGVQALATRQQNFSTGGLGVQKVPKEANTSQRIFHKFYFNFELAPILFKEACLPLFYDQS